MSDQLSYEDNKIYFKSQTEICFKCDLFPDKTSDGSKIIMLFAEVFSFMVDVYGLNNAANVITQYSNTPGFKKWFWGIKYKLGEILKCDPSFYDIGKWIGKGFFLKICISLVIYNGLVVEETILSKMIKRQKKLLKQLLKENCIKDRNLIEENENYYKLFNEKISLVNDNELFYLENLII